MLNLSLRKDIGIDLGTASCLVYVKGKGIVLSEPSVVAVDLDTDEIIAFGREAQMMIGRTPANIVTVRPLRDGVISQYDRTLEMLQYFLRRACGPLLVPPRVVICVPSGITEVEERAVEDAVRNAGARAAYLIEEPVAAAIGAGIDISAPSGHMVVDIGGGTTDIAVISLEGVVVSESIKVAGDKFDEAIIRYVRQKYNILIGERTAESIKIRLGTVFKPTRLEQMDVKGRCLAQGLPKYVTLNNYEMLEALLGPITAIIDAICQVIERTHPELVADIINNGIVMTGGGSLLRGFDKLITDLTGIHTYVAKDAISCVAIGTGKALDHINILSEGSLNFGRAQKRNAR